VPIPLLPPLLVDDEVLLNDGDKGQIKVRITFYRAIAGSRRLYRPDAALTRSCAGSLIFNAASQAVRSAQLLPTASAFA
jgi:hypothetical protein